MSRKDKYRRGALITYVCRSVPLVVCPTWTVPSSDADARSWPSGEKVTAVTDLACPYNILCVPSVASPSRTIPPDDPNAISRLSGEKVIAVTDLKMPLNSCHFVPAVASQSWTLLSYDPDAISRLSGEMAIVVTQGVNEAIRREYSLIT